MKEKYIKPEIEIIELLNVSILTASGWEDHDITDELDGFSSETTDTINPDMQTNDMLTSSNENAAGNGMIEQAAPEQIVEIPKVQEPIVELPENDLPTNNFFDNIGAGGSDNIDFVNPEINSSNFDGSSGGGFIE